MNAIRNAKTASVLLLTAIALAASTGCSMPKASDLKPSKLFSLDNAWPWASGDEPEEGTPARMVGAWTDTVLTQSGQKPQRGFGGRLMFYGSESEKPILVDGQLVVYAFDETGREQTDNKPTRRYVFPADQMPLHMSKTNIGASYSFWLPWDEAGGPKTEVSLICRFEPKGGALITGEQTRHLLPGALTANSEVAARQPPQLPEGVPSRPARPTLESLQTARRADSGAQLASFESPGEPQTAVAPTPAETASTAPARQMTVTSIALPKNFQLPDAATNIRPASAAARPMPPPPQPFAPIQPSTAAPIPQPPPANPGFGATQRRPAIGPVQLIPTAQPQGVTLLQTQQPLVPQIQSWQQTPIQAGVKTTISYPPAAELLQRPAG